MSRILIYTLGDKQNGLGHVKRQIVLARELVQRGIEITFETPSCTMGYTCIHEAGFNVQDVPDGRVYTACIVDMEHGPELSLLQDIQAKFRRVVIVGGVGFAQKNGPDVLAGLCDLQIYQAELFDYPSTETALNGPEYLIIDRAYVNCTPNHGGHIVVSMGGSDPHNLTGPCLNVLAGIGRPVIAIIGPAAEYTGFYSPTVEIVRSPENLVPYLDGAAVCVTATGMTTYESLCAGVPVVLTNWSKSHERTALELAARGVAYNTGLWSEFDGGAIRHAVECWIKGWPFWKMSSNRGRILVDGRGVERVSNVILKLLE